MSNSLMNQLALKRRRDLLEEAAQRRLARDAKPLSAHAPMPRRASVSRLRHFVRPAASTSTSTSAGA
jgi:hypothetical protein